MKRGFFFFVLCISLLILGDQNSHYMAMISKARMTYPSNVKREVIEVPISGEIVEGSWSDDSLVVYIKEIDGQRVNYKWQVYPKLELTNLENNYEKDTSFSGTVNINIIPFSAAKNKLVFDYDKYLYSKGITGKYTIQISSIYRSRVLSINTIIVELRGEIKTLIQSVFPTKHVQLINAVLFGERDELENYEAFKKIGLAHLFAISGLHFGVLFSSVTFFTRGMPRIPRFTITTLIMTLLLLLIGAPYSAQRAFFIILYREMARLFKRKSDVPMSIAFSVLIILVLQPYAILSTSLYLSYYAYIAIVIIYPALPIPKYKSKIIEGIKFSIAVQLILLPISIYYFNTINLLSFIANLVYIPLISIFLPTSILTVIFIKFPIINIILKVIVIGISSVMQYIVSVIPYIESNVHLYYMKDFNLFLIVIMTLLLSFVFWRLHVHRRKWLVLVSCILITFAIVPSKKMTQVVFYDVGHGDMVLIRDGDFTMLIDTGDGKNDPTSLLRANGITQLDYLILSHDHNDHTGGFDALISNITITNIIATESFHNKYVANTPTKSDLKPIALSQSIKFEHDNIKLQLSPVKGANFMEDPNEAAIITRLEVNGEVIYFLADIYDDMIDSVEGIEEATIVKTAHHGSKTSISNRLYKSESLKLAVSSCNYKYAMPAKSLESLLQDNQITHMTTYTYGQIILNFGYQEYKIDTYLN
ncbi:MAG: DNA internalization-related competence protein ComEC/Rec2 [Clostridiales bacterium 38-18]|nr:MAG: DNA internalization-related competence protein ComEC/Rec2 [Clostridiales bacterium 38-18]